MVLRLKIIIIKQIYFINSRSVAGIYVLKRMPLADYKLTFIMHNIVNYYGHY